MLSPLVLYDNSQYPISISRAADCLPSGLWEGASDFDETNLGILSYSQICINPGI